MQPIVVPNTAWTAADPTAYNGGRRPTIAHLAELELEHGPRDPAGVVDFWSGSALQIGDARSGKHGGDVRDLSWSFVELPKGHR